MKIQSLREVRLFEKLDSRFSLAKSFAKENDRLEIAGKRITDPVPGTFLDPRSADLFAPREGAAVRKKGNRSRKIAFHGIA